MAAGRAFMTPFPRSKVDAATRDGDAARAQEGVIEVIGVSKTYGRGSRAIRALSPTTIRIEAGSFVSIVGPSGGGKTTLLKVIGDIIDGTSGQVLINGRPARAMREEHRIGYVFQTPVLLPWRTVYEKVLLPFQVARGSGFSIQRSSARTEIKDRVETALHTVGLGDFMGRLPRELSGGMQARVGIARALVHEPDILLMDEPFASLDELTRGEMALHLLDVWERVRTTVVFVTHHIEEAVLLANRVVVMSARPGEIRREVEVDLPRPRSLETRRAPLFREIVEDLIADFHRSAKPQ
jgi:NitT/TauT family transport system ATP-binding protein